MKIYNIPFVKLNKNDNAAKRQNILSPLKNDVFVKQNALSFQGATTLDGFSDETKYLIHDIYEGMLRGFLIASSDSRNKVVFNQIKNLSMQRFLDNFEGGAMDVEFIKDIFSQAEINSVLLFQRYLKIYNSPESKKVFKGQEIEELEVYSQLKSKDDLTKYGELLLYLYNQNSSKGERESKVDLNEVIDFLKQMGLYHFKDFDEKFAHLKSDFNDFQNISDKSEAIEYLMLAYPEKVDFINDILSKNPASKKITADKIYFSHPDIIDYLYEENYGRSLEPLPDFFSCLLSDKIKKSALNCISEHFNEFSTSKNKVDFYKFLVENDVSPEDFNSLATGAIISDSSILDRVKNKNLFVKEISSVQDVDSAKALEIYKQYSDIVNSLYSKDETNSDRLKTFFDVAEMFNIRNSYSLLGLYNNVNGTKNRSITTQECKDFIDTMAFCFSNKIFQEAKSKKVNPIDIINREKEHFLAIKGDIEDYVAENKPILLLGLSSREIYIKYRNLLKEDSCNVKSVLENIVQLNIENSEEYKKKTSKLNDLSKYFSSKEEPISFIKQAKIKLDGKREDEEYIANCQNLLKTLQGNSSEKEYATFVQYITQSDFIAKSKNSLSDFLSEYGEDGEISNLFSIIAGKKVPSAGDFMDFISEYKDDYGKYDNLLKHLSDAPDNIDFQTYIKALNLAKQKIQETNVPVKMDNSNIQLVDMNILAGQNNLSPMQVVALLNTLSGADEHGNFISKLENSFTNKSSLKSRFEIANEIANKEFSQEDKYNNIVKLFKLSKQELGLNEDCANYIYIQAITQALPADFVDFINSNDWLKLQENAEKYPNISLHAKLRLIDRFALQNCKTAKELYKDSTKESVRDVLKSIYIGNPNFIAPDKENKNIITMTQYKTDLIKTIFGKNGKMITIIAKGR